MSVTLAKQPLKKSSGLVVGHGKRNPWGVRKTRGGVVNFCVHGPTGKIMASDFTPSKLVEVLRAGLPVQELHDLQASLDVPMERLFPMLGISKATLHRRKAGGRLGPAESDRIVRFARLMGKAVEVLESEGNARQWLTSPQFGLGGAVPLDYAETEVGAREVENLLGRIEYGVYS
jgi:putative toxin-antitoxin system antitoxin component (TIGR02293 family)